MSIEKYSHLNEWKTANRWYRALIEECGLTTTEKKVIDQLVRDRHNVDSLTKVSPAEFHRVAYLLNEMTLKERCAFLDGKLRNADITPTPPSHEDAVLKTCASRLEGRHMLTLEETRLLRRALVPHMDDAEMCTDDGTRWIVEVEKLEVVIWIPAKLNTSASINITRTGQTDLTTLCDQLAAITGTKMRDCQPRRSSPEAAKSWRASQRRAEGMARTSRPMKLRRNRGYRSC